MTGDQGTGGADPSQADEPPSGVVLTELEFRAALDAMLDYVAIGVSVRDDEGQIVDFVLAYLNSGSIDGAGRAPSELMGGRVRTLYPGWVESGQMGRFQAVVETGIPYITDRIRYEDVSPDGTVISGYWSLSVVRFGDGYIAASRDVTHEVEAEEQRRAAAFDAERTTMAVDLLQRAALPARLPVVVGLDIGAHHEQAVVAQPIGGDWYDAFSLGDGRVGLVIADVSGHGPDAAAFMVQVRNVVRALAIEHHDPDIVLERANVVVTQLEEHSLFATCCYGVLDRQGGSFSWARAGHFEPLLASSAPRYLTSEVGPPLGVAASASYPASQVEVREGDRLVLFTDGLVERRDAPIGHGLASLIEWTAASSGSTAQAAAEALAAQAVERSDDLAVLCVHVTGIDA